MIEGLKLHVKGEEIISYCEERLRAIAGHVEKIDATLKLPRQPKEERKPPRNFVDVVQEVRRAAAGVPDDVFEALSDIKDHFRGTVLVFQFVASHVRKDETYLLEKSDMQALGWFDGYEIDDNIEKLLKKTVS